MLREYSRARSNQCAGTSTIASILSHAGFLGSNSLRWFFVFNWINCRGHSSDLIATLVLKQNLQKRVMPRDRRCEFHLTCFPEFQGHAFCGNLRRAVARADLVSAYSYDCSSNRTRPVLRLITISAKYCVSFSRAS